MRKLILFYIIIVSMLYGKEKVFFVEDPWPPYSMGKLSSKPTSGIAVELIEEIFKNKYDLEMKLYPWKRAILLAKNGLADGLILTLETEKRKKFFVFSDPLIEDNILIFQKKDKKEITYRSLEDLKGLKIGVILGSAYSNEFQKKVKSGILNVEAVSNIETNIKKLINDKIDVLLLSQIVSQKILKMDPTLKKEIRPLGKPLVSKKFKIAISKRSFLSKEENIAYINKRIKKLKKSGKLKAIILKYK